jgi:restriction system protein
MPMTWNDAAEKVLSEEKKPLHYKELTDKILERKLVETEGKTPHLTLYASISVENKSRQEKGRAPRFTIEKGEVSLVPPAASTARANLLKQIHSERENVKSDLLKKLRQLSGGEFESYLETLLIKLGYENVELRGGSTDEGIDLFCEMSQGINQVKTGVQAKCKQAQREVGPKDVRLLRDVLPKFKCSQGVLITTSKFNHDAYEAATEEGRQPIILIDGDKLADLALEHEVGVKTQKITIHLLDDQFDLLKPTKQEKAAGRKTVKTPN